MLFIDSRNSNKMAAVYTFHNSLIRNFNCLYFPKVTLKSFRSWVHNFFSASQIDCIPLNSPMQAGKHQSGATRVQCFLSPAHVITMPGRAAMRSCGRASVFRSRTISLKPFARFLSYCIHTSLRGGG